MHYITSVHYASAYKLRLRFEDQSERVVDLASHLDGEMFAPLKDLRQFQTAHLNTDLDTVVWANGADMSPDFLFEISVPVAGEIPASRVAEDKARYGK